jgi:hypothetical protein
LTRGPPITPLDCVGQCLSLASFKMLRLQRDRNWSCLWTGGCGSPASLETSGCLISAFACGVQTYDCRMER